MIISTKNCPCLVHRHVRHPDVVLLVHRDHVRHEEHVLPPGVDDVARAVQGQDGRLGDRVGPAEKSK